MIERLKDMRIRLAIGGLAVAAIVALGVVPMVAAASPSPSTPASLPAAASPAASTTAPAAPAASAGTTARGVAGIRAAILRGAVRADVTVVKRDGSTVLVHYERGQVTAITPTSITIQGRDGKGATFTVTGSTRVRARGQAVAYATLKVGDRAMVFGTASGGTYTAVLIRCFAVAAP